MITWNIKDVKIVCYALKKVAIRTNPAYLFSGFSRIEERRFLRAYSDSSSFRLAAYFGFLLQATLYPKKMCDHYPLH